MASACSARSGERAGPGNDVRDTPHPFVSSPQNSQDPFLDSRGAVDIELRMAVCVARSQVRSQGAMALFGETKDKEGDELFSCPRRVWAQLADLTPEHTQAGSSRDQLALWRFLTALGGGKASWKRTARSHH